MSDGIETSVSWMQESGKALLTGAGSSTIFGAAGGLYYYAAPSTTYTCSPYNGDVFTTTLGFPRYEMSYFLAGSFCHKVVRLPIIGPVDSLKSATIYLGVVVAAVVFFVALVAFCGMSLHKQRLEAQALEAQTQEAQTPAKPAPPSAPTARPASPPPPRAALPSSQPIKNAPGRHHSGLWLPPTYRDDSTSGNS